MTWTVYVCGPRRKGKLYLRAKRRLAGGAEEHLDMSAGTRDRAQAEELASEWAAQLAGAVPAAELTLGAVMELRAAALDGDPARAATASAIRQARRRLEGVVGPVLARDVDRALVIRAQDALGERFAPLTVNGTLAKAAAAWTWARDRGQLDRDWPRVRALARGERRKRPWQPHELAALLEAARAYLGGRWLPPIALLAETGLRVSEVVRLRGRDLDRTAGAVTVLQKGQRTHVAPVGPEVLAMIAAAGPDEWLFPALRRTGAPRGGPITREGVYQAVRRLRDGLGIADSTRLDVHSLRRAYVADSDRAGVPADVGRRITGHRTSAMWAAYQAETVGDDLHAAAGAVRAYRAAAAGDPNRSTVRSADQSADQPTEQDPQAEGHNVVQDSSLRWDLNPQPQLYEVRDGADGARGYGDARSALSAHVGEPGPIGAAGQVGTRAALRALLALGGGARDAVLALAEDEGLRAWLRAEAAR